MNATYLTFGRKGRGNDEKPIDFFKDAPPYLRGDSWHLIGYYYSQSY